MDAPIIKIKFYPPVKEGFKISKYNNRLTEVGLTTGKDNDGFYFEVDKLVLEVPRLIRDFNIDMVVLEGCIPLYQLEPGIYVLDQENWAVLVECSSAKTLIIEGQLVIRCTDLQNLLNLFDIVLRGEEANTSWYPFGSIDFENQELLPPEIDIDEWNGRMSDIDFSGLDDEDEDEE